MAFDYAKSQATAKRLLTRFGSLGRVTIKRNSTKTLDPVAGEFTGGTEVLTQLTSATVPIKKSLIDGERIKATDIMFLASSDFKPLMSDIAVIDTKNHIIINIEPVSPNAVDVIYKVVCRG